MNIDLSTPIRNQAFFAGYVLRQKEGGWVVTALKGLGGIGKAIVTYALLSRGIPLSRNAITQELLGRRNISSTLKNLRKTPPRRGPVKK